MSKLLNSCILALLMLSVTGCASTLEEVNKGAESAGKTSGKIIRVPTSASQGAAKGIAGETESNPYGR